MTCRPQRSATTLTHPPHAQHAVNPYALADDVIAMFEIVVDGDSLKIADERHFRLVPADQITEKDLAAYRRQAK